ncbi:major capsid protein [Klebsiella pneumoniae]|uniref:major capsid protein n=1 Tax=Klebsiella pneumoniae TaxID=573 RepID=UPI0037516637
MANFNYSDYGMINLIPAFEMLPSNNYLLQNLNIFDKQGSADITIAYDRIANANRALLNTPKKRFSMEHDATKRGESKLFNIEIPYFHREDTVSSADIQRGIRRPGTNQAETMDQIVFNYMRDHATAHKEAVEESYARCLFKGEIESPFTPQGPIIKYTDMFDAPMMTDTVDLTTGGTLDVIQQFNEWLDRISEATQGLYNRIRRVVVFAGVTAFSQLQYHQSLREAFKFVDPNDPRNIVTQRTEILGNVVTFTLPGLAIDVIKVADPSLTKYLEKTEMVMIPVFEQGTNGFVHVFGPASADTNLAERGDVQEVYSYLYELQRGNREIVSEAGILPINNCTGMTLKITTV